MNINGSVIQNNTAKLGGGVFSGQSVQTTLIDSSLIGNQAIDGGGFQCSNCAPSIFSATFFVENSAISGGGMSLIAAQNIDITQCHFSKNSAILNEKWSGYEKLRLMKSVRCKYAGGGAICTHVDKNITIQSSVLSENLAMNGGWYIRDLTS